MGLKVELTFDALSDLFELIQTLSKPDPRLGTVLTRVSNLSEKVDSMSDSMQTVVNTLRATVQRIDNVKDSVDTFAKAVPDMIQRAVDAAVAKGATPEQMAEFQALNAQLVAAADEISADVVVNTSADPAPVEQPPAPPVEPTPVDPAAPGEGVPPVVTDPADTTTIPPDPANT